MSDRQNNWLTPSEILALNKGELPATLRSLNRFIEKQGWRRDASLARKAPGREGGGGWLYHVSALPGPMQARLALQPTAKIADPNSTELWQRYEALSNRQKATCEKRLKVVSEVEELLEAGSGETVAVQIAAKNHKVSPTTLFNWRASLRGVRRADWLAALAPKYHATSQRAECDEKVWSIFVSDLLRPEEPSLSSCYRRVAKVAKREGWVMPSERALRRRVKAEIPNEVFVMARKGRDQAKAIYPAQRRTRDHLHAMQAVNIDGHKVDVFVRLPDGKITRMILIGIQDLYSNKFVAWRISETENKETARLVIGDMVENYGIPDMMYSDNGRAFASKWITGGVANRYRYKVREEEPEGLLVALGVKVNWTTPASGQSKPIERAFKDFADDIAKHPVFAGAYTGNSPNAKPENYGNAAVDLETFKRVINEGIAEHNAREGRRTLVAKGRSFDAVFTESMADAKTIVRWPTKAQRSLWLLAADRVRANRGNGELSIYDNRYWSPELTGYAGKMVTVRFDPDNLMAGLKVYDATDQFICEAGCIEDTGFDNVEDARVHNRKRNQYLKAVREQQRLTAELKAEDLARIYSDPKPKTPTKPVRPAVTRVATGSAALKRKPDMEWDEEAETNFSKGLKLISGGLED